MTGRRGMDLFETDGRILSGPPDWPADLPSRGAQDLRE